MEEYEQWQAVCNSLFSISPPGMSRFARSLCTPLRVAFRVCRPINSIDSFVSFQLARLVREKFV